MKLKKFLKETYLSNWEFIKESKKFIFIIIGVFFVFAFLAFLVPTPEPISKEILKIIYEILEKTKGLSQFELIKFIFINNVQSSFFGLALGIFLGIFPVIFAAFNGYVLGFVAAMSVELAGSWVLWKILPHGIFELPAVFISLGLGLRMGVLFLQPKKPKPFKHYLYRFANVFIFVVVPLLIIAAFIEGSLIFLSK